MLWVVRQNLSLLIDLHCGSDSPATCLVWRFRPLGQWSDTDLTGSNGLSGPTATSTNWCESTSTASDRGSSALASIDDSETLAAGLLLYGSLRQMPHAGRTVVAGDDTVWRRFNVGDCVWIGGGGLTRPTRP